MGRAPCYSYENEGSLCPYTFAGIRAAQARQKLGWIDWGNVEVNGAFRDPTRMEEQMRGWSFPCPTQLAY